MLMDEKIYSQLCEGFEFIFLSSFQKLVLTHDCFQNAHLEFSLLAFWAWDPSHDFYKALGIVIEGLIKIGLKLEVD